eukprot:TRINITY_DN3677_c0_g1_i1.p1 TRINITY_DN3677_c0_g1~~TRINITY_DN3677_c0_g1_i1.p1  ORF type:complete len:660 (+),score=92.94 TRINITY_DN3677_c0_g1_i1:373-2352(+)
MSHMRLVLVTVLFSLCISVSRAQLSQNPFRATFPIEIMLKDTETDQSLNRPVAIVAGFDTTMYVASVSGQLMLVDVKTGSASIINPGGDDQPFGGLCLDSRGPGTLYATGRHTGALFAFNRRGELLRKYQLTTVREKGGTSFLTACIQTRYQLLVMDSNNARFYYLPLADEGPLRGHPPPLTDTVFQGKRVSYEGDAYVQKSGTINAYGVEWTRKFNETAYVLNSATGELFTMGVKQSTVIPVMRKVNILGRVNKFVGALGILFDSTNENIMYISMPHLNAIAVLEFSRMSPRQAKFIRYLKSALANGPVAIGEFGNWLFPISGDFGRSDGEFSITQIPRHEQIIESGDSDSEFTTFLDDVQETPLPVVIDTNDVQDEIRAEPSPIGTNAPAAIVPPLENPQSGEDPTTAGQGAQSTDPTGESPRESPTPTPVSVGESESEPGSESESESESEFESEAPDREPSTFGVAAEESQSSSTERRACFPAEATVLLDDGSTIRMESLRVGDRVQVDTSDLGEPVFSDVFMFSHQDPNIVSSFVSIEGSHGQTLHVSPGHYIYINGKLLPARQVRSRDVLQSQEQQILAVSVSRVRRRGLYNPQTVQGNVMVNGIKVSTYTTAMPPVAAMALMAPIRAAYTCQTRWPHRITSLLSRGFSSSLWV